MGDNSQSSPWRWVEATITAALWAAPTGLISMWMDERTVALRPLVVVAALAGIVGYALSLPLSPGRSRIAKTATAQRITTAVAATMIGAAAASIAGVLTISTLAIAVTGVLSWLVLAVATGLSPIPVLSALEPRTTTATPSTPSGDRGAAVTAWPKRVVDIVGATVVLIVSAPVLLVTAIAIKASDGGPVFFRQTRIGRDGNEFAMLKFRSMVTNAEALRCELEDQSERSGPLFKMSDDPRITTVGSIIRELSIDELPQLINIVRGDMSLVGPRPALPDEFDQFDERLKRRVVVTPGLTGLWQAEARSDASFDRFRELDLRYVASASPLLDFMILLATVGDVLTAVVRVPLRAIGLTAGRSDGIVADSAAIVDLRSGEATLDLRTTLSIESTVPDQAA